jgi:L-ascorbate metabolism protein UlaG (beta-lactamase superfamily)
MKQASISVRYLGHSTIKLEFSGLTILTDPVMRERVAFLRRQSTSPDDIFSELTVLLSHSHHDHLDIETIKSLEAITEVVAPISCHSTLKRAGIRATIVSAGDSISRNGVAIHVVPAVHVSRRWPWSRSTDAIGFVLDDGTHAVYFAGDTDIFPGMKSLHNSLDLAFLPVWGWGPTLGRGHLNPETARQAALMLGAHTVIPIHWGTYWPTGLTRADCLTRPPYELAESLRSHVSGVNVAVLDPGQSLCLSDAATYTRRANSSPSHGAGCHRVGRHSSA